MGGFGSGARRSAHVGDVENALALDIRVLRRLGLVRTGECIIDTVHWRVAGLSTASARLRIDLSDVERCGVMSIMGDMPNGPIKQQIAIKGSPSRFGGWRCYFICPITSRRCEILYYSGGRFASRRAQRLTYATQNMGDLSRAHLKAAKLLHRLKGSTSLPRPRGRNRIDYVQRLREAEFQAKALYVDRLRDLTDRSGTPRVPSQKR